MTEHQNPTTTPTPTTTRIVTPPPAAEDERARDDARDAAAAAWAEDEMTLPAASTTALRGADAAEHGRASLEAALGGAEEVQRAVRGRPTLGRSRAGGRSPKRQVTLSEDLDRRAAAFIEAGGARDFSSLLRTALSEHLDAAAPR